jgi:hypothetical protein
LAVTIRNSVAPSFEEPNTMAPSSRATARRQAPKTQNSISTFVRVSKNTVVSKAERNKSLLAKKLALEKLDQLESDDNTAPTVTKTPANKRKRSACEESDDETTISISTSKKIKVQLPSPPRSSPERDVVPTKGGKRGRGRIAEDGSARPLLSTQFQDFQLMHNAFIKAFALHRAHNGPSAPADLSALLNSVTRLYKKRAVTVADLQRMLAFYEKADDDSVELCLKHRKSPFKLFISGLGADRRHLVEFVGFRYAIDSDEELAEPDLSDFTEHFMQSCYETRIERAVLAGKLNNKEPEQHPYLDFEIGAQTVARQNKAAANKLRILGGRKTELDVGKLSIKDESEPEQAKPEISVKSRTLSLFDRVKAKQLANAAVDLPSADDLRRKHALGRSAEIVEILRMKQQQKLGASRGSGKVSFTLNQIVAEIKASMAIPMGASEITLCLEILAEDLRDGWLSIFELGATRSVVLNGAGRSGAEVARIVKA